MNLLSTEAGPHWERLGLQPHHGIALPLFSLHSCESGGIGEYPDLIKLIDWCVDAGLGVIQLLPLNDTGIDPSPYASLSALALNPIYLNLAKLPGAYLPDDLKAELATLTRLERVDYAAVREAKLHFLETYIDTHRNTLVADPNYQTFLRENLWLDSYALFKAMRARYDRKVWELWPANAPREAPQAELDFHKILQYFCSVQMEAVKAHAEKHNVKLMGDLPILVGRNSCDVLEHRELFDLAYNAGAPPDYYNKEGQDWTLPVYNWEENEAQEYRWWKERLAVFSRTFHLYRLDHIVGFFRLWSIPPGQPPRAGHYIPPDPEAYLALGLQNLRMMVENSPLLPVGEDLGTVPETVKKTMGALGIPGTKVVRWEEVWQANPKPFPEASLTTVSTHDGEPLRLWWETYADERQVCADFHGWSSEGPLLPENHRALLAESHQTASLLHINPLTEYLGLFEDLRHERPEDERINVPGTITPLNWTYRFRPSIEEMARHPELTKTIREMTC